jgi:hypothetical protein
MIIQEGTPSSKITCTSLQHAVCSAGNNSALGFTNTSESIVLCLKLIGPWACGHAVNTVSMQMHKRTNKLESAHLALRRDIYLGFGERTGLACST